MKQHIITNGLSIPMEHGIPIYGKLILKANPKNPFWRNYSIGYYVTDGIKVMVRYNTLNQFVIINNQSKSINYV